MQNAETANTLTYTIPYLDPQCKLNVKKIHSDSDACEDFEMIGRNSR